VSDGSIPGDCFAERHRSFGPDLGQGTGVLAAIGLGSNVGDRRPHILHGFEAIASLPQTRMLARSSVLETDAVTLPGAPAQGAYLNAAALIRTSLPARELLESLLKIERARGRDRAGEGRWGPRTLDLDLLVYGPQVIREPELEIPHPRLAERRFVLEPLAQIAPDLLVPIGAQAVTVAGLLARLNSAPPG
jgi:2-amino-4-hydroxy-6-hydroxymethyldihydropteridine diphosphokinase